MLFLWSMVGHAADHMDEAELAHCRELLGLQPGHSAEELEKAFLQSNFALIKGTGTGALPESVAAQKEQLRRAHDTLAAHLRSAPAKEKAETLPSVARSAEPVRRSAGTPTPPPVAPPRSEELALFAFDNWRVNVLVPPLLLGLVWLVNLSPLGFLLRGFQVWVHEFGHATAAWMTGRRALPLPFGWTPVEPDYSPFVYFGLLLLFGVLFVAGWEERKAWPMMTAAVLAVLQYYLTWRMPVRRQEFWWGAFGGVGGEFYLSTLFMMLFYVQMPEKFKWGACRYVFFLIGATAFLNIVVFWNKVYHGLEEIPFGSMINGEDDAGGDMNKLMDAYGWTKAEIRRNYQQLGHGCWIGLGVVYAVFALRLNKAADWVVARLEG